MIWLSFVTITWSIKQTSIMGENVNGIVTCIAMQRFDLKYIP